MQRADWANTIGRHNFAVCDRGRGEGRSEGIIIGEGERSGELHQSIIYITNVDLSDS